MLIHLQRQLTFFNHFFMLNVSEPHSPHHQISPIIVTSPARVKPSSSLSLSETEDEPRKQYVETNEPTLNQVIIKIIKK